MRMRGSRKSEQEEADDLKKPGSQKSVQSGTVDTMMPNSQSTNREEDIIPISDSDLDNDGEQQPAWARSVAAAPLPPQLLEPHEEEEEGCSTS